MNKKTLAACLQDAFAKAFPNNEGVTLDVVPATDPRFGDFQCNNAMSLAKILHLPPRVIAQKIVENVDCGLKLEIAGPGFINITVTDEWIESQLDDALVLPKVGGGKRIIVDYSSPNIAKPMHIGHIRSTIIGNTICRIYRALGWDVIADNHLGDWGTQFGIMIKGFREFADEVRLAEDPIAELERVYVTSYGRTKEDEQWLRDCRGELVKLQQGDPENLALWNRFIALSRKEFERVYARLGVTFDLWRGESFYNDKLAGVVKLLDEKGLATESDGATVVNLEGEGLGVAIVRKTDGGFNYATTDIACVLNRVEEFAPEKIVYVTDERQQLHFNQFFSICSKLGVTTKLEHVWFGLMRLPEGTFSTRQGNVIKLEALLDEAERRAAAMGKPELAAPIGIGAVKYADLSHDPQNLIVFTWDKALALDGNSGPYLQYAYARIRSVLDKAGEPPTQAKFVAEDTIEKQLALKLLQYPAAVQRAADSYKPNQLADYLFELAQLYSSFYQRFTILKAAPELRASRLRLCAITAKALRDGLKLLGIETPERI